MKCYKAKWILTSNEVLEDMAIVVDEGKIIDIIPAASANFEEKFIKDFGNFVITPGFIDMLTQYQYSEINKFQNFSLKKMFKTIAYKYNFAGVKADNYSRKWADILCKYSTMERNQKLEAFKHGAISSIKAGTTCIVQVSKEFKYFDIINKLPIKNYLFFEVFADSKDKSKKTFKNLRFKIEDLVCHKSENTHIGVMLNSISGVHRKLWALFSKYCRKHNMIMMTRFAESQDEIEWLEHGFSDIDLLHKFMGMRKISPYSKNIQPVEYLEGLKVLTNKVIAVNANYADMSELKKLADTGAKFIYQPVYSEEICNKKLDFKTVLEFFPKNFGFSTQSFAQNSNYSLMAVARNANFEKNLDVLELLKYLTIYPAKILRLENSIGSIEVGKDADFNVFKLMEGEDYNSILEQDFPFLTYVKGKKLVKDGEIRFTL